VALACVVLIVGSCTQDSSTIRFWHFWSEPSQRAALEDLVAAYEQSHPNVHIELTPLSWSDGKAKLQLAFNAGTQPDVVHVGMDWFAEFNHAGLFVPINAPTPYGNSALWVVNARALLHWTGAPPPNTWGLCASDAHNVLKRTLPLLWRHGAGRFYSRLPISADMDSLLVDALWAVRGLVVSRGLVDQGRMLDQRFLRGEISYLYSGAWMLDMATAQQVDSFEVIPTRSILNGDVLAVSKQCKYRAQAEAFVVWLTAYEQAKAFCLRVSDAGIPASPDVYADSAFRRTPLQRGFLETVHLASPLPSSPSLLSIEPVVEELIERCYALPTREAVRAAVAEARLKVTSLENLTN
jgi:ABC-type glycerol-3-phosphate transport system substrate-binding protein